MRGKCPVVCVRRKLYSLEGPAVVRTVSVHEVDFRAGQTAHWPVPAVADPSVQVPVVKVLKTLVQRHPPLQVRTSHKNVSKTKNQQTFACFLREV